MLKSAFRFQGRGRPLDTVSGLVLNLFSYQSEDLLHGDYMIREYDEGLIRRFLAKITPRNLRMSITAPEVSTDRLALWCQTPYSVATITEADKIHWQQSEPDKTLPNSNPFISSRLARRTTEMQPRCQPALSRAAAFASGTSMSTSLACPKSISISPSIENTQ